MDKSPVPLSKNKNPKHGIFLSCLGRLNIFNDYRGTTQIPTCACTNRHLKKINALCTCYFHNIAPTSEIHLFVYL